MTLGGEFGFCIFYNSKLDCGDRTNRLSSQGKVTGFRSMEMLAKPSIQKGRTGTLGTKYIHPLPHLVIESRIRCAAAI